MRNPGVCGIQVGLDPRAQAVLSDLGVSVPLSQLSSYSDSLLATPSKKRRPSTSQMPARPQARISLAQTESNTPPNTSLCGSHRQAALTGPPLAGRSRKSGQRPPYQVDPVGREWSPQETEAHSPDGDEGEDCGGPGLALKAKTLRPPPHIREQPLLTCAECCTGSRNHPSGGPSQRGNSLFT